VNGPALYSHFQARERPAGLLPKPEDYKFFAEQKKAQDARIKQEQRAGVIDRLLNETNKQGEKTEVEGMPVKEVAPAK
jgi:hypothetical protein